MVYGEPSLLYLLGFVSGLFILIYRSPTKCVLSKNHPYLFVTSIKHKLSLFENRKLVHIYFLMSGLYQRPRPVKNNGQEKELSLKPGTSFIKYLFVD